MTLQEETSKQKPMPYSSRVLPVTVLRLEMLAAVYQQPIGHLIDQMVAKNFRLIQDNGRLTEFMALLEESEQES